MKSRPPWDRGGDFALSAMDQRDSLQPMGYRIRGGLLDPGALLDPEGIAGSVAPGDVAVGVAEDGDLALGGEAVAGVAEGDGAGDGIGSGCGG